ncbi:protein SRC2 homolog isoform X6 [Cornus florida]|uniref:protein SRC2 homolog isoform X6 n=1 Tax=Cornus florida TaxID=4283 RepID=UPI00289E922F|nr:protein SRC2 homolog isoform X6 [Cornus florida]XP_059625711.1 protein SRC2 homolog isoform X6 [Cornus florida]
MRPSFYPHISPRFELNKFGLNCGEVNSRSRNGMTNGQPNPGGRIKYELTFWKERRKKKRQDSITMEHRSLEITLISAKGLKDVSHFSEMDVYVVVKIDCDPRHEQRTPVDKGGGTSPSWNHTMKFSIDEAVVQTNRQNLVFQLRCDRSLLGDKDIGVVHVPIKELLDSAGNCEASTSVTYPVRKNSGKAKGKLKFCYKFGQTYKVDYPHAHAYKIGINSSYPPPPVVAAPYPPMVVPTTYPPRGEYGCLAYGPSTFVAGPYPPPVAESYPPPPSAGYPQPASVVVESYPPPPAGYPKPASVVLESYPPPPAGYPQPASVVLESYLPPPAGYPQPVPLVSEYYPPPPAGYPEPAAVGGGYGYFAPGYPPPPDGYPTVGPGYGYQSPMQQQPKKNEFGSGLGALVGGVIGGLLVGDMVSGGGFDAGFDAGFDNDC